MQTIYQQGGASNIALTAQKRTLRPVLAQTQGFPYPAYLDPSLRNTDNSIRVPLSSDTVAGTAVGQGFVPLARTATAFTYQGSLVPGTVMVKQPGSEYAVVANGVNTAVQPWGLLGQYVGGLFDNIGQNSQISVWSGPDSVYDLIAPGWNDNGLAAAIAAAGAGAQVLLYGGTDGRLCIGTQLNGGSAGTAVPVARVIQRWSAARLTIQLLV